MQSSGGSRGSRTAGFIRLISSVRYYQISSIPPFYISFPQIREYPSQYRTYLNISISPCTSYARISIIWRQPARHIRTSIQVSTSTTDDQLLTVCIPRRGNNTRNQDDAGVYGSHVHWRVTVDSNRKDGRFVPPKICTSRGNSRIRVIRGLDRNSRAPETNRLVEYISVTPGCN